MTRVRHALLHDHLVATGARLVTIAGRPTPESFGDGAAEYEALTQGTAVVDRSFVGRLRHRGADALDLLNRFSTNEMLSLEDGQVRETILTSSAGRIIDVLTVVRWSAAESLVLTGPGMAENVSDWLDRYTFDEDSNLEDITGGTAQLTLAGPGAPAVLRAACGADIDRGAASRHEFGSPLSQRERARRCPELVEGVREKPETSDLTSIQLLSCSIGDAQAETARADVLNSPAYDIVVPAEAGPAAWDRLVAAGAVPAGLLAFETVRIERGVPAHGRELTEDANPLEAGLERLISFSKGCYMGQEVIARLDTYDRLQRRLVGLVADAPLAEGAEISADGRAVGRVTSAARSPALGRHIGLGYVRLAWAERGTALESAGGAVDVAALPLVGG